jgi:hypothetical protein
MASAPLLFLLKQAFASGAGSPWTTRAGQVGEKVITSAQQDRWAL